MQPKVSVIVPIFKAEDYLPEAIDKILNQTFVDYELLLIDDGNIDKSGAICDDYASVNSCIRVFHETHFGVSHSRQVGIENAEGEYIMFIDADDVIEPTFIEEMYQTAKNENADLVLSDYKELKRDGVIYREQVPTSKDGITLFNDIISGKLYGALWNKMLRTECVRKSKAFFDERLSMREDVIFLSKVLPFIYKIAYLPKALYGYNRRNANSLTFNYLDESLAYYQQDVLGHQLILKSGILTAEVRDVILAYYHELSYITMRRGLFNKKEWFADFIPFKQELQKIGQKRGYKGVIVNGGLNGHFLTARILRTIIARIKKAI